MQFNCIDDCPTFRHTCARRLRRTMMLRRHQPLIAALSIALLAIDALVGALGHSHGDPLSADAANHECGHHAAVCHHEADDDSNAEHSSPAGSIPDPYDDCSLC